MNRDLLNPRFHFVLVLYLSAICVVCVVAFGQVAFGQVLGGKGAEMGMFVLHSRHFDVVFPPRLETEAKHIVAAAEHVRGLVVEAFDNDPNRVTIVVNDETDVFNGFAVPSPDPVVRVFATWPRPDDIGMAWEDLWVALTSHELAHVAHLTTRDPLRQFGRSIIGAAPGVTDARVPPGWFLEGLGVLIESEVTSGGRVRDARVQALRRAMALAGTWPSLIEAGVVGTAWPGGNTRYAFGAGFVAYLEERFGWSGIRAVIRAFNGTLDFSSAFFQALGFALQQVWDEWTALELGQARAMVAGLQETGLPAGEFVAPGRGSSGAPAWRWDGALAFWDGSSVRLLEPGARESRLVASLPSRPDRLSWADDGTLVYSRLVPSGVRRFGDVFRLHLDGREERLSWGARARDAVADGKCVLYARLVFSEDPDSKLMRSCEQGASTVVYAAADGWVLMQPAISSDEQIALTVWRPGGFLDVAQIDDGALRFVTSDVAEDEWPSWTAENRLIFSSSRGGTMQAYCVESLFEKSVLLRSLSAAPGGALNPVLARDGRLAAVSYDEGGQGVIVAPRSSVNEPVKETPILEVSFNEPTPLQLEFEEFALEPYTPRVETKYGYPWGEDGPGLTLIGADPTGLATWGLVADAPIFGAAASARLFFAFTPTLETMISAETLLDSNGPGVRLTPSLSGTTEWSGTAIRYGLSAPLELDRQGFSASLVLRLSTTLNDLYGYPARGWRFGASVQTEQEFNASGQLVLPIVRPLVLSASVARDRESNSFRLEASMRFSLPLRFRLLDGVIGLDRVSILPFFGFERINDRQAFGLGAELAFDGLASYLAPVSFGMRGSYWGGNDWRFSFVTRIPQLDDLR